MNRKEIVAHIGKEVIITYENQKQKPSVLSGTVSVCRNHEFFLRGSFPGRRASKIIGGIWLNLNRIISLEEQEQKP